MKRKKKDNTLIAVFAEQAREEAPIYERVNYIDGREVRITVHDGDHNAIIHTKGERGGAGIVTIVPLNELFNLVDTLRAKQQGTADEDFLYNFNH